MTDRIITHHVSPYHAIQGTPAQVRQIVGHQKKTRDELDEILYQMEGHGVRVPRGTLRTKTAILAFIETERRAFWDERHVIGQITIEAAEAPKSVSATAFSGITASECNAWLRTLPVVSLHGEA